MAGDNSPDGTAHDLVLQRLSAFAFVSISAAALVPSRSVGSLRRGLASAAFVRGLAECARRQYQAEQDQGKANDAAVENSRITHLIALPGKAA